MSKYEIEILKLRIEIKIKDRSKTQAWNLIGNHGYSQWKS